MLISPDLFLDCILYIINNNTRESCDLIKQLINVFEGDVKNNSTIDNNVTKFYIKVLKSIIETGITKQNKDELRSILLKFQSDAFLTKKKEIYQLLYDTFMSDEYMSPEKIEQYSRRIMNVLIWYKVNKTSRSIYGTLARAGDMINPHDQAEEMNRLRNISQEIDAAFSNNETSNTKSGSLIEHIDLSDKTSMQSALTKNKERAISGILRTGLQGLNRMLGKRKGFARGESVVFYALPHHYKSGMIMSIAAWTTLYNIPSLKSNKDGAKPIVLLLSLENEAYQNFVWMFRHFYETQNLISSEHLTDDQVTDWAYDIFNAKGYTLIIERHLPEKFNYPQYVSTINRYKNSGYEIILAAVDYINLMAKDGLPDEAALRHDLSVRALFSAMCNYNKTHGITFISAHPLNRKAKELAASGITNIVKRLDTSHLADSFDVAREVDLEIFIHIERNLEGVAYLTMQRGKHRYVDDTPLSHQYCAYRFHPQFGIRDDILYEPEYVQDIFSDVRSSQGDRGEPKQPKEENIYSTELF